MIGRKTRQIMWKKVAKTVVGPKRANFKAKYGSPKHLHKPLLKSSNIQNKLCFEIPSCIKNCLSEK
jgi:hypothetical protein